jgi:4-amino-4-deoxy-L-arabinose transferase-like glycosyltransferase
VLTLLGVIVPPRISLILGSAIALAGPALADIQTAGEVWGLLTGAGLAAAGVWRRQVELLIIGALGVVGYAIAVVYRLVGDDLGAANTLLLSGVILVAGALVTARLAGVSQRPPHDPTSASGVTDANATSQPSLRDQHRGRQP